MVNVSGLGFPIQQKKIAFTKSLKFASLLMRNRSSMYFAYRFSQRNECTRFVCIQFIDCILRYDVICLTTLNYKGIHEFPSKSTYC